MQTETDLQSIHIPPATAHVATVRAFVGAIGRHVGCSDEVIEDLRLAASEACAQVLQEEGAPDGIELRTSFDGQQLIVEIEPCATFDRDPEGLDDVEGATRRALIEGLFPEATFERRDDRALLRLAAPTSGD